MDAIRQTLAERIAELERQNAGKMSALEDLWGRLHSAEAKSAETLKCFNIADAAVAKMRTALEPFAKAADCFSDQWGDHEQ